MALSDLLSSYVVGDSKAGLQSLTVWLWSLCTQSLHKTGHDLTVCEFETHMGLCADSPEPGACFKFYVSFSLCPSPAHALFLSLSLKKEKIKKCFFKKREIKKKKETTFLKRLREEAEEKN